MQQDPPRRRASPRPRRAAPGGRVTAPASLLLASLLACSPPSPPPSSPPPAPSAQPVAPAAPAAPSAARPAAPRTEAARRACEGLREASIKALDQAMLQTEELQGEPLPDLSRSFAGCFSEGPWGVVIEAASAARCAEPCAEVRWRAVHVDTTGQVRRGPEQQSRVVGGGLRPQGFVLHDWTGDGEPEVFFKIPGIFRRCGADYPEHGGTLWTLRGDEVVAHAPARQIDGEHGEGAWPIHEVRDADGDGRPDLLTPGPFVAPVSPACSREGAGGKACPAACASGQSPGDVALLEGPLLVAHARPDGTFSLRDEVAQRFSRSLCPRPPASVVLSSPKLALLLAATARTLTCARLWGAEERASRELREHQRELCPGTNETCPALAALRDLVSAPPPVVLR